MDCYNFIFIGIIMKQKELFYKYIEQCNLKTFDSRINISYNIDILNNVFKTKYTISNFDNEINKICGYIDRTKQKNKLKKIHNITNINELNNISEKYKINENKLENFKQYVSDKITPDDIYELILNCVGYPMNTHKIEDYYNKAFYGLFINDFAKNADYLKIDDIDIYHIQNMYIYGYIIYCGPENTDKIEMDKFNVEKYKKILTEKGINDHKIICICN